MKLKLMLFLATFSMAHMASACPDLSGDYLCKTNDFRRDTVYTFSQVQVGPHWEFTIEATPVNEPLASSFSVLTDGKEREVVDQVTNVRLMATSQCTDLNLLVTGRAKVGTQEINFSENLSLTKTNDLSNVSLDINGNSVLEVCERL